MIKRFATWLWGNDVTTSWSRLLNGTLWMRLPAVQIWCFYFVHDERYIDFQNGNFADFGQDNIDPTCLLLLTLGLSQLFYWVLAIHLAMKNSPNPLSLTKNWRTTHRIWQKSFSIIQLARIKIWLPKLINRNQRFSFLFLDLCNKIKYAWRK